MYSSLTGSAEHKYKRGTAGMYSSLTGSAEHKYKRETAGKNSSLNCSVEHKYKEGQQENTPRNLLCRAQQVLEMDSRKVLLANLLCRAQQVLERSQLQQYVLLTEVMCSPMLV